MSTSFNFPANPTLNQIVTLPEGEQAQWNGYAWVSLENNVTYPLAISNGGTGATNPLTAKRNLGIPIWTLDDAAPAAPVFGDRWIRPGTMTEVVWMPNVNPAGSGVWVDLADAGSTAYPVPISKGGTGATTAAQARINLGIDYTTTALLISDGTQAAPGLAFNSEPGLGWYRRSASNVSMVAGGQSIFNLDASNATTTVAYLNPRTAGSSSSVLYIGNYVFGTPNYNILALNSTQTGYAVSEIIGGTATAKPLTMIFPAGIIMPSSVTVSLPGAGDASTVSGSSPALVINKAASGGQNLLWGRTNNQNRWLMILGDAAPEGGTKTGSNFSLLRYDNSSTFIDSVLNAFRDTGMVSMPNNPGFHVRTSVAPTAGNVVLFNLVDYNRGNGYAAATGRFTAPIGGVYRFSWQHLIASGAVGEFRIGIYKNGGMCMTTIKNVVSTTGYETIMVGAVVDLVIGDYVTCVYISGPTTLYLDQNYNQFCGEFVG